MAKNSGRRSAADVAAATFQGAIAPARKLSPAENRVWERVVAAWPAAHWISSDAEILTQYCAVCVAFDAAQRKDDLSSMEKAGRLALSYATKLRLTPQSRYDYKGTHTEAERGRENEAAADRLLGGVEAWDNRPH